MIPVRLISALDLPLRFGGTRNGDLPRVLYQFSQENQKVIGVITDRDVRTRMSELEDTEARSFAKSPVISVTPETSITEAARLLREHKIGGLPVVQDSELVGIITVTDVLAALTEQE